MQRQETPSPRARSRARRASSRAIASALLLAALFTALLLGALSAQSSEITIKGNLRVKVSGNLAPKRLPRNAAVPVSVSVGGTLSTTDGSEPPQLRKLTIEINRHGRIESAGLPTCDGARIRTASNGHALAACGPALVGEGKFFGTITLPGSAPYAIVGKLLVFNAEEHGHPVLLGHVYSPHPFATSFLIPFAIKHTGKGTYGTVLTANLKRALGSQKNLTGIEMTLSRRYSYKGTRRSYVSAACSAPKEVPVLSFPLARTSFAFASGVQVTSVLSQTCRPRR